MNGFLKYKPGIGDFVGRLRRLLCEAKNKGASFDAPLPNLTLYSFIS
jgi:hypothetical protein